MRFYLFLMFFCNFFLAAYSQSNTVVELDSLYREDQIYIGVTYNALINLPSGASQNSFSTGFHLGIIRDFPINKRRNVAIGLGLGYSINTFIQNIRISETSPPNYTILEGIDYSKNNFSQHLLEVPFELRWRTSNPETYKFWRVYTGIKLGYLLASKSVYKGAPGNETYTSLNGLNTWQYGLTLSVGYNTWNGYIYYGLNPIFDSVSSTNGQSIDMSALKIGLIFYIL
jgi:hypothetical protein